MKYKEGYKYQLVEDFILILSDCPHIPGMFFKGKEYWINKFTCIYQNEQGFSLLILKGYAWDGATGALDTKNFMAPSMVHDALLESIGLGKLPADEWKLWTDNFLIKLCKERGMNWFRRLHVYCAVRWLGDSEGSQPRKILVVA